MTASELYNSTIKPLPTAERLRLATLILNDIPPQSILDDRDEWTEEDLKDFSRANWRLIEASAPEGGDASAG